MLQAAAAQASASSAVKVSPIKRTFKQTSDSFSDDDDLKESPKKKPVAAPSSKFFATGSSNSSVESSPSASLQTSPSKPAQAARSAAPASAFASIFAKLGPTVLPDDDDDDIDFDGVAAYEDDDVPSFTVTEKRFGNREIGEILFSQNSIMDSSEGVSLDDLKKSLCAKWDVNKSQALCLVRMPNGKLVSLDNRRLKCLQDIAKIKSKVLVVPVSIHQHDEPADKRYLTPILNDFNKKIAAISLDALKAKMPKSIKENSYGFCVFARMRVFNQNPPEDSCLGYAKQPTVRKNLSP